MRDVKFRGFDLETNKWLYGYYIKHIKATPCLFNSKEEKEQWYKNNTEHLIAFDGFSDWWMPREIDVCTSIDPLSIGQITEVMDIYANEICEGDIVKVYSKIIGDEEFDKKIGVVEYLGGAFWVNISKIEGAILLFDETKDFEIIGNIYENSDILKIKTEE